MTQEKNCSNRFGLKKCNCLECLKYSLKPYTSPDLGKLLKKQEQALNIKEILKNYGKYKDDC